VPTTGTSQSDTREDRHAYAVLSGWRVTSVSGTDARAWLHDLITADVDGLRDRRSRRSLLLTPTGRIRADFHVASVNGSYLLLQAPEQPEAVDAILRPYVLSSDVRLEDRTDRSVLVAVLDGSAAEDASDEIVLTPSVVGSGHDVVAAPGDASARLLERLRASGLIELDTTALETRRIRDGIARMGADFGPDALPAEAGLEGAIDFTKGCFLGQESVAKIRNLGHPPRVLARVRSDAPIAPGAPVVSGEAVVGEVTSAAAASTDGSDGVDAIVRIRWDAERWRLATAAGPLVLRNVE
jgi:folate-binding protein YgfZ